MDLKEILELLGQQRLAADDITGVSLDAAVAGFAANRGVATRAIRALQASAPAGFVMAALRMLTTRDVKSPGLQYMADLTFSGDLLIDTLIDKRAFGLDTVTALARNLATVEPLLDVRMVNKLLANVGGDICSVDAQTGLRVLSLVEAISDCSRMSTYLGQLMLHPSTHMRSKAALLLGRANLNLNRTKGHLASEDSRIRANAVEALWGRGDPQILTLLQEAARDKHPRVALNALVGLCKVGNSEAVDRLKRMAIWPDASVRRGAAWAMGALESPEFALVLATLEQDADTKVRAMAARFSKALPMAQAPDPQPITNS